MTDDTTAVANLRFVEVHRVGPRQFEATNQRGGSLVMGEGDPGDQRFTPVELLLAAIAGCSGIDVDYLTSRRSEPERFDIQVSAEKLAGAEGNHLGSVSVRFVVEFPDTEAGRAAEAVLPKAIAKSRDRLCTVSRTVSLPTPVSFS